MVDRSKSTPKAFYKKNSLKGSKFFHKIYFDCLRVNTFLGQLINVCYPLSLESHAILESVQFGNVIRSVRLYTLSTMVS